MYLPFLPTHSLAPLHPKQTHTPPVPSVVNWHCLLYRLLTALQMINRDTKTYFPPVTTFIAKDKCRHGFISTTGLDLKRDSRESKYTQWFPRPGHVTEQKSLWIHIPIFNHLTFDPTDKDDVIFWPGDCRYHVCGLKLTADDHIQRYIRPDHHLFLQPLPWEEKELMTHHSPPAFILFYMKLSNFHFRLKFNKSVNLGIALAKCYRVLSGNPRVHLTFYYQVLTLQPSVN